MSHVKSRAPGGARDSGFQDVLDRYYSRAPGNRRERSVRSCEQSVRRRCADHAARTTLRGPALRHHHHPAWLRGTPLRRSAVRGAQSSTSRLLCRTTVRRSKRFKHDSAHVLSARRRMASRPRARQRSERTRALPFRAGDVDHDVLVAFEQRDAVERRPARSFPAVPKDIVQ